MFVGRMQMFRYACKCLGTHANAFTILWRHLNAYSNAQHSDVIAFKNNDTWKNRL